MRNVVVCCDGTWNTPTETDGGLPNPTNVVKIYNAAVRDDRQSAYYHPGVGTGDGWWDHLVGGGVGEGLDQNTMSAYSWLASSYRPGDQIFAFGFSRGAYTARSLCGFIARYGLLDLTGPDLQVPTKWQRINELFAAYRSKTDFANKASFPFHNAAAGQSARGTTPIHFIGVWDTVGAVGIPDDLPLLGLFDNAKKYGFHDTALSPIVRHARHAVAIDERRASFAPTLWSTVDPATDAVQLWFPGVHGDVGGGYLQDELSDGALKWMIDEAQDCGLRFHDGIQGQLKPNPLGVAHDSCGGVFKFLKTKPRAAPRLQQDGGHLHASCRTRLASPPLSQGEYWRTTALALGESMTVDVFARERWNATGAYLEAGVAYELKAHGEWVDHGVTFSAAGDEAPGFHLHDVSRFASAVLGDLESLYKSLAKQQNVDFWWTRRVETEPWLALMGFVASDLGANDQTLPQGETFEIGEATTFTPRSGGYLYCFANDAWQTYNNNRGSVSLTIARRPG